ncbi:MAG TPA: UDP-N-acetylglucosamine 2-epimerase (non-hydrolyzing) [Ktedonobacterales bacterium]
MKIVSVVGARPQFIKLAPVSRAIRAAGHHEIIVHTGQHYDERMSGAFFVELDIPQPDHNLGIGSGRHGEQTGHMLAAIEDALLRERPDGLVVFGDTNSTLAAALAAVKLHIPVGHVEAGLRSFDRKMPEEINRVVTDHVASQLYCPTQAAVDHLKDEGVTSGVHLTGDVMFDMLLSMRPRLEQRERDLLRQFGVTAGAFTLATVHRAASTDDPEALSRIMDGLQRLESAVVFPIHPRTRKLIDQYGLHVGGQIQVVEPLGYLDMLTLTASAFRVVTDSGGVQKEAFLLGTPCVTLRDSTEWPETINAGWNTLVAFDPDAMLAAWRAEPPDRPIVNPYGEGDAAQRIAALLSAWPATR